MIFDLILDPLELLRKGSGIGVGIGSCNGSVKIRQHPISWTDAGNLTHYGITGPQLVKVNFMFNIGVILGITIRYLWFSVTTVPSCIKMFVYKFYKPRIIDWLLRPVIQEHIFDCRLDSSNLG